MYWKKSTIDWKSVVFKKIWTPKILILKKIRRQMLLEWSVLRFQPIIYFCQLPSSIIYLHDKSLKRSESIKVESRDSGCVRHVGVAEGWTDDPRTDDVSRCSTRCQWRVIENSILTDNNFKLIIEFYILNIGVSVSALY